MTIITADQALPTVLASLKERAEIRDAAGNLLGYFTPRAIEEELLYQHAAKVFEPNEIRRQLQDQTTGASIEQVLNHLRALEKS